MKEPAETGAAPMRLLCDEALGGLARWLRAAGHDAATGDGERDLLARAVREGRVLLTRSRRLAEAAGADSRVVFLPSEDVEAQARLLRETLGLDWTCAPFSRCLVDNALLQDAGPADLQRLPPSAQNLPGPFRACPVCGRVYWPGSHVKRMMQRLERWALRSP